MYKNDQYSQLPDGSYFEFWDINTQFTKTYYVSKAANASDDNPGTKELPFATINKAAQVVMPGERVEIGGGVYDEFVRPARGGESPEKMISYEAAEGEKVVLTGAKEYKNGWKTPYGWNTHGISKYDNFRNDYDKDAVMWEGSFNKDDFDLINPFSMVNCASQPYGGCEFWFRYLPKESDWQPFLKRRGLIMVDGEPLWQVNYCHQLSQVPGSYWVEDSGYKFIIRLKDDGDPRDHVITYTCREQLFSPAVEYTAYVRVKGLEFEYVGNGCPGSQKGALSTNCGSHWIIENNTVRWANGVGIDIGHESPMRRSNEPHGYQIVRGNKVSHCGVCGIAGVGAGEHLLAEYNVLDHNCWHDIEFNYESGGFKTHGVHNGLIRFNIITNNGYGPCLWTDFNNRNERICYNVCLNSGKMIMGAIFVEASDVPNRVDHNVIWGGTGNHAGTIPQRTSDGGHGIYEHDSDNLIVDNNILLGLEGAGVFLNWGDPIRICNGHGPVGRGHKVNNNIIANCGRGYVMPTEFNEADENIMGYRSFKKYPISIEREHVVYEMLDTRSGRMFHGWEKDGKVCDISYSVDQENLKLTMVFTIEDAKLTKEFDLTKPLDLSEVQAFANEHDASGYEGMRRF